MFRLFEMSAGRSRTSGPARRGELPLTCIFVRTGDAARTDALLRHRLENDVWERSDFHRTRLLRAGLDRGDVRNRSDLGRLPPMDLADVRSPSALLLQRHPTPSQRTTARRYWPLQWVRAGFGVPLGYSADDLDLLADLGAELLTASGVTTGDMIANLLPAGPSRDNWQFVLGAQRAGVSSLAAGPGRRPTDVDDLAPSVLVGEAREVVRLLDAAGTGDRRALGRVHTIIAVGKAPTDRQRARVLDRLGANCAVIRAWAPEGVLALWGQCRGGDGLHSWPAHEVVEVVDSVSGLPTPPGRLGRVLWTGAGWYASALIRLATADVVSLDATLCPTCGRRSPRVRPGLPDGSDPSAVGFSAVLDADAGIDAWVAELRRSATGVDELLVWLAPVDPGAPLAVLERVVAAIGPARLLVTDRAEVDRRFDDASGQKVRDCRAVPDDGSGVR